MFYIIGLGLGDVKDITVKGLEIVRNSKRVYLEAYTSILTVGKEALEEFYGRELIIADRDLVEQGADQILHNAANDDVALLVVGDPFSATTHTDLSLRAREAGISCQVIHNASIMNAVGCTGLQGICSLQTKCESNSRPLNLKCLNIRCLSVLPTAPCSVKGNDVVDSFLKNLLLMLYNFGETVSIPYWTDTWKPDSFYDKITGNLSRGLHTLCLLDIKVKEPTLESLTKKKKEYEPPRFMSVKEAASQLLEILNSRSNVDAELSSAKPGLNHNSKCVGVCRVGSDNQKIVVASLQQLSSLDLGPPLHSLVVVGHVHPLEEEYMQQFVINSN